MLTSILRQTSPIETTASAAEPAWVSAIRDEMNSPAYRTASFINSDFPPGKW
ncbi:Uncharacterised protein [Mycobacteroides abscessus subsp. abscessus]|nr:Uncharacterised protein [Mycobacteroides abscessus subsp. abscessus]